MRKGFSIIAVALCFILLITVKVGAIETGIETLTIKGDGISKEVTFTREELLKMTSQIRQETYSVINNYPTEKIMYRKGVLLNYLLEEAGIKDSAKQLKFSSSDGYSRNFTRQELLNDERYYFAADGTKKRVPAIIAFSDSIRGFDHLIDTELVLTMGQRVKNEQNNPWFVKYLEVIEVSNTEPEQWAPVTFTSKKNGDKTTITLDHPDFDAVKLYYTIDGTDPTLNSTLYNVSATHFQPELNKPIQVKGDTEVRAIAIGAGKLNSIITSTKPLVVQNEIAFNDLEAYSWSEPAIKDLAAKGIIKGMGDGRFAPGEPLTRAQFATMMMLALGKEAQLMPSISFSDVKDTDWYAGYVEKAAALGLIQGYPDGTFRPEQFLTRQEMLIIAVKAKGITINDGDVSDDLLAVFADESRISDWARGYVAYAENMGIIEHGNMAVETDKGLLFDGQKTTVRAEAAMTIYLMLMQ